MSATGSHQTSPRTTSAMNPPRMRILSASGSRNAPDRVVPSRRASQPSRPSVEVSTNQRPTVSQRRAPVGDEQQRRDREHEPGGGDEVRRRRDGRGAEAAGARGRGRRAHARPARRAAGASARASRSGPRAPVTSAVTIAPGPGEPGAGEPHDAVDLRVPPGGCGRRARLAASAVVGAVDAVDEHLDDGADERVRARRA